MPPNWKCQPMHVCFSMSAATANRCCGRALVIVASFAVMDQSNALRFKASMAAAANGSIAFSICETD